MIHSRLVAGLTVIIVFFIFILQFHEKTQFLPFDKNTLFSNPNTNHNRFKGSLEDLVRSHSTHKLQTSNKNVTKLYYETTPLCMAISGSDFMEIFDKEDEKIKVARLNGTIPKFIHQSWKQYKLEDKFYYWHTSWRELHPDWIYVFWTDSDNENLVRKHFPWFWETYNSLELVILKADVARNMYMYKYGGVYADLDMQCLRNMEGLFNKYTQDMIANSAQRDQDDAGREQLYSLAFLAQMGTNSDWGHSVPNAWMASSGGHPLWLMTLEETRKRFDEIHGGAEDLTGPVSLKRQMERYFNEYLDDRKKIYVWAKRMGITNMVYTEYDIHHSCKVIGDDFIYPFNWADKTTDRNKYCNFRSDDFSEAKCKEVVHGAYAVTFWSHSWE